MVKKVVKKKATKKIDVAKDILDLMKIPMVIDRKLFDALIKRSPLKEKAREEAADILLGMIISHHPSLFKDVIAAMKYGESWFDKLPAKMQEALNRDRKAIIQSFRGIEVALIYKSTKPNLG